MSDSDIPNRFGPAVRWVLAGIALFVFFLLGAEEFKDGKMISGGVFSALFLFTLIVAVKWDRIVSFFGRDKVTLILIAVGILCALGLGVVVGVLLMRNGGSRHADSGRIVWNFDQIDRGASNFLNIIRLNQDEMRVVGVGIHGKNTSNDPVSGFKGYVRSDLTNAVLPFFIMADEPANATSPPNPFMPQQIPTRPEETFGIPGSADFDLVTFEDAVFQQGVSGIPVSQFLREFGAFTVVLEYDSLRIERRFPAEQVRAAIAKFEKDVNPERTTAPRVTRRPDAEPPKQPMLPLPVPVPPNQNGNGK